MTRRRALPTLAACAVVVWACTGQMRAPETPQPPGTGDDREAHVVQITTVKEGGGRLDWSAKNLIAFDQLGADRYFDIYTMRPDGANERCLTCDRPELPNRHMGNPAWHPDARFLVFQAQKAKAPRNRISDYFANPGAGVNNDIWIMDTEASRFWQLTDVPMSQGAVLHPHFSPQGNTLLWAERLTSRGGVIGQWALKVADFVVHDGMPRLENVRQYQPGAQRRFYESHSFRPDGAQILFSGNPDAGQSESGMDIYWLDLASGEISNLTRTPKEWDEHAQISPRGNWIVWMSSMGPGGSPRGPRSDFWMMRPDGSSKRQITFLNQRGRPEYIAGGVTAADNTWSPDGSRLLGYVIRDLAKGSARTILIEFSPAVMRPRG